MTQLIGAIRRVRREVSGVGDVIAGQCRAHDYDHAGRPAIAWDDEHARAELVDALVGDAHRLLGHLPEAELGPKAAEALALLALVAGQDVEPVEGSDGTDRRWRIAQRVASDRVISTVDPGARHAHKTVHRSQGGFKAHLAIEPDTGMITDCQLTKASGLAADGRSVSEPTVGLDLLEGEDTPSLAVLFYAGIAWSIVNSANSDVHRPNSLNANKLADNNLGLCVRDNAYQGLNSGPFDPSDTPTPTLVRDEYPKASP